MEKIRRFDLFTDGLRQAPFGQFVAYKEYQEEIQELLNYINELEERNNCLLDKYT